jgi:hypothetical protein
LVEVGKVSKTTVFNLALIVPVLDLTGGVVVASLVEGVDLAEVTADRCDVVGDNVNHNPDALGVGCFNKVFKFLGGSKVGVNAFPVFCPVTMVSSGGIFYDGTNPDSVESHTFNIRKTIFYAVEGTSAVTA